MCTLHFYTHARMPNRKVKCYGQACPSVNNIQMYLHTHTHTQCTWRNVLHFVPRGSSPGFYWKPLFGLHHSDAMTTYQKYVLPKRSGQVYETVPNVSSFVKFCVCVYRLEILRAAKLAYHINAICVSNWVVGVGELM